MTVSLEAADSLADLKNTLEMKIEGGKRKILELEGLRGAAALAVLLCHVTEPLQTLGRPFIIASALVAPLGGIAVMVFFILSGFVIGHTNQADWSSGAVRAYLLRRVIRLYPIYLVALLLSFVLAGYSILSTDFLGHLLFLQGLAVPVIHTNGPLWSLHYEAIYYLAYLAVWRWGKPVSWTFAVASLAATGIAGYAGFHLAKVASLFGFWLFGHWLATTGAGINRWIRPASVRALWCPLFLVCANLATGFWGGFTKRLEGASGWELALILNGPLIADIFLSVRGQGLKAKLVKVAYGLNIVTSIIGLGYGWRTGLFGQMLSYPVALGFLLAGLLAWPLRNEKFHAPSLMFPSWHRWAFAGSVSYALYVIHYPILKGFVTLASTSQSTLTTVLIAMVLSLLGSFLLESVCQPYISQKFRPFITPLIKPQSSPGVLVKEL